MPFPVRFGIMIVKCFILIQKKVMNFNTDTLNGQSQVNKDIAVLRCAILCWFPLQIIFQTWKIYYLNCWNVCVADVEGDGLVSRTKLSSGVEEIEVLLMSFRN